MLPLVSMTAPHDIKQWLYDYAVETIAAFNIDESHGITHLVNTYLFARLILREFATQSIIQGYTKAEEEELIADAAFTHDLIDKKYMSEPVGIARLTLVLNKHDYGAHKIAALVHIISSISFSHRIERRRNGQPMIDPGPLHLATAIVVDADQLDGFDVERCRLYQTHRYFGIGAPLIPLAERSRLCRGWIKTILIRRVLRYIPEYMNTQTGLVLGAPLHDQVADYVAREYARDELFEYP